ncbi:MAG: hypothetical protein QOG16_835, partial [Actinomycetota bacterium]|nr:hypothetical protein [Actinomycetota bacterium]
ASAQVVEQAGFPAVATSSGAVAAALGFDDSDSMPVDEAFAAVSRVASSVSVPVTGDMEAGYGLEPVDLARRLIEAGAVGCNLEDTDHHGDSDLVEPQSHAKRIQEIKEHARKLGVDIVLNARVDVFLRRESFDRATFEEGVARARLYLEAGADCIYPIGLSDHVMIGELVSLLQAPINIMMRQDTPPIPRLTELGVARVSFAGWLMRKAYSTLLEDVTAIAKQAGLASS